MCSSVLFVCVQGGGGGGVGQWCMISECVCWGGGITVSVYMCVWEVSGLCVCVCGGRG